MRDFYVNIFLTLLLAILARDGFWLIGRLAIKSTQKNIAGDFKWRKKVGAPIFDENGEIVVDSAQNLSARKAVRKRRCKKLQKGLAQT